MKSQKPRKGLLLLNLGTPEAPRTDEVRSYLKEFLMDPYVIDIPFFMRWLLVHVAILPKRPAASAIAYKKVWTDRGSPLLYHHLDLTEKVQKELGDDVLVLPGMRYGNPSIREALMEFCRQEIFDFTLFPLYPQYSLAATESSVQECRRLTMEIDSRFAFNWVKPFYQHDLFIESFVKVATESLKGYSYDHLLFSFHGLPERQIRKTDSTARHCFEKNDCCEEVSESNSHCYRAQCYVTASRIAKKIGVNSDRYTVCFQSRLGRTPWIKPYTDELYQKLPQKGIKKVAVLCPAFVADCLETLEEIQIRGREDFIRFGGEDLRLVPSLNSDSFWAASVSKMSQTS